MRQPIVEKSPFQAGPLSDYKELWVYFDSGVSYNVEGQLSRVNFGVAMFEPNPTFRSEPIMFSVVSCGLGQAIGSWDLELVKIWNRSKARILDASWVTGSQVYDLIAARGAALHLRTNSYGGRARFFGDGAQVIRFLNGEDSQLSIQVEEFDIAARIRQRTLEDVGGLAEYSWSWIETKENLADRLMKQTVAERSPG